MTPLPNPQVGEVWGIRDSDKATRFCVIQQINGDTATVICSSAEIRKSLAINTLVRIPPEIMRSEERRHLWKKRINNVSQRE